MSTVKQLPQTLNITQTLSDELRFNVQIKSDDVPVDLTGKTIEAKLTGGVTDFKVIADIPTTIVDAADGKIELVSPEQEGAMTRGWYLYVVEDDRTYVAGTWSFKRQTQPGESTTADETYVIEISGVQGPSGEITSVDANTLAEGAEATVENTGTTEQADLVFGIPKGDKGDKGDKGEKGEDGAIQDIQGLGNISGVTEINIGAGRVVTATLTDAVTLSFTGEPEADKEISFSLRFTNPEEITWPVGTKFAGGTAPVILGDNYQIECSLLSDGQLFVWGVVDDIGEDT